MFIIFDVFFIIKTYGGKFILWYLCVKGGDCMLELARKVKQGTGGKVVLSINATTMILNGANIIHF